MCNKFAINIHYRESRWIFGCEHKCSTQ